MTTPNVDTVVAMLREEAGIEVDDQGWIKGAPCPFVHEAQVTYESSMGWSDPDDGEGLLFFVECNCGAQGPLATDPVEAVDKWMNRQGAGTGS